MYLIYEEIFNMEIVKGIEENDVLENLKSINRDHMCKHPLNQILYGPAERVKLIILLIMHYRF